MASSVSDRHSRRSLSGLFLLVEAVLLGRFALMMRGDPIILLAIFAAAVLAWTAVTLFSGRSSTPRVLGAAVAIIGMAPTLLMFVAQMMFDPVPPAKHPGVMFAIVPAATLLALNLLCAWRVWTLPRTSRTTPTQAATDLS